MSSWGSLRGKHLWFKIGPPIADGEQEEQFFRIDGWWGDFMVSDSPTESESPILDGQNPELPAPWGRTIFLIVTSFVVSSGICWCLGRDKLPNETGKITGRAIPLVSDWTGKIESYLVKPGDFVQEGDPIAILIDERLPVQLARTQREVEELQTALRQAEQSVDSELNRQLPPIDAEIANLKMEDRNEPLQLDDARIQRLRALETQRIDLAHRLRQTWGIDHLREELVEAETKLRHLQIQPLRLTLPASVTGKVNQLLRQPGQRVVQGTPLLELADQEHPYLVVEMPEPLAKRFALGDQIPLKFPGLEKGLGRVANMERLESPELGSPPSDDESDRKARIRVMIEPEDGEWPTVPLESAVRVRTADSKALSRRVN